MLMQENDKLQPSYDHVSETETNTDEEQVCFAHKNALNPYQEAEHTNYSMLHNFI